MSEQSQEWTVDESPPNGMRGRIMISNRLPIVHWQDGSIGLQAICKAHNAALNNVLANLKGGKMNEQPQEWTRDNVYNHTVDDIVTAHNAAIAAEQENKDGYSIGYATAKAEYSAQLAAEQIKIARRLKAQP
jgi:hypothetical protein